MTLHGNISVNYKRIGWWDAQRITTDPDGQHTYRWRASADHGELTGVLRHNYRDGATLLAALVLQAYVEHTQCYFGGRLRVLSASHSLCEWAETTAMDDKRPSYTLVRACEHHRERP